MGAVQQVGEIVVFAICYEDRWWKRIYASWALQFPVDETPTSSLLSSRFHKVLIVGLNPRKLFVFTFSLYLDQYKLSVFVPLTLNVHTL